MMTTQYVVVPLIACLAYFLLLWCDDNWPEGS